MDDWAELLMRMMRAQIGLDNVGSSLGPKHGPYNRPYLPLDGGWYRNTVEDLRQKFTTNKPRQSHFGPPQILHDLGRDLANYMKAYSAKHISDMPEANPTQPDLEYMRNQKAKKQIDSDKRETVGRT